MNNTTNMLLRLLISYGISDKERFTSAFEKVFGEMFEDPEKAEQTGAFLMDQLRQAKEELTMSMLFNKMAAANSKDNEELTKAIQNLTAELSKFNENSEKNRTK
jgi:hypothetical protein